MELAGFDLYRYDLPLVGPVKLKGATLQSREGLLLRLTDEAGNEGWGEAAPLPGFSRETLDEATRQLCEAKSLMPEIGIVTGRTDPGRSLPRLPEHTGLSPSVRFALELAAWNLISASTNETPMLTGNRPKETILVNGLISVSREKALADALYMARTGYRAVKLKVGGCGISEDVKLVRGVRDIVGDDLDLRLDANRAWSFEEAVEFGRGVAGTDVEYVEEPLSEPWRLAELARGWGLAVALDETLVGMKPAELDGHGYARAVVLKPTLLGGISQVLSLAEAALRLGMKPVVSSSYESGVGTAALVAMAAAVGEEPAGLDTYRRLAEDVIQVPLELPAPSIAVGHAMETARRVDLTRLEPVRRP